MGKYISFGAYNPLYKYLWIYMAINFIWSFIVEGNFIFDPLQIDDIKLPKSYFVRYFMDYLGKTIGSIILIYIEQKRASFEQKDKKKGSGAVGLLIFEDNFDRYISIKNIIKAVVVNVFFIVVIDFLEELMDNLQFDILYFWSLEILCYALINSKISNSKLYKHHWVSIIFIIIFCTSIQIIIMILELKTKDDINYLLMDNSFLIPVGFLYSFFYLIFKVYFLSKSKYFFDKKYVNISQYLFFYGFVGLISSIICGLISSYIPCSYEKPNNIVENICPFKDNDNLYFDSFKLYFQELYEKNFIKKLFILIFEVLEHSIINWLALYIYKILTPIHHFSSKNMIKLIISILKLVNALTNEKDDDIILLNSILNISSIFFYIIGAILYLEFIELRFCGLNRNTRKHIISRAKVEGKMKIYDDSDNDSESELNIIS